MTDAGTLVESGKEAKDVSGRGLAFTLLIRLPDGFPKPKPPWHTWPKAAVPPQEGGALVARKRYPGGREYFAPQVQAVLFPPLPTQDKDAAPGGRWIREPVSASLELGGVEGAPDVVLTIELLELVQAPLHPLVSFGVVHMTTRGALDGDAMIRCSKFLSERWRSDDQPRFAVEMNGATKVLRGHEPTTALANHLFGGAHRNVLHRAHIFVVAQLPDGVTKAEEAMWRRALGRGHSVEVAGSMLEEKPGRDDRRTEQIAGATATFFGRSTVLAHRPGTQDWVYAVRSYWSETVLFALIQQSYLETYARQLGEMGREPLSKPIEALFRSWVAYRNVLWWRELSYTTDMPGRVIGHIHRELNTELLFGEIEDAFATYVEARRHRTEDAERGALRGLQVYGAAFAVVSAAATVTQVATEDSFEDSWFTVVLVAVVLGVAAALVTHALLAWRQRRR
jgi:hypothetical protein